MINWKSLKHKVRSISYTKTTTIGPDGKVVRETTILNDGGECETPAEVKAMQDRMGQISKTMQDHMGQLSKVMDQFDELLKD